MRNLQRIKVKLSGLISDEYTIYEGIADEIEGILEHRVVNHGTGEWARGNAHVNGCENRNQFLKMYLRRYRGVSKKYLQGDVDFLALLLNEGYNWYDVILSDDLRI